MTSRLRVLGLRVGFLCALVATVLATHLAVPKPDLPFVLLESFDRAFSVVYDAAEREVARLEAPGRPQVPRRDVCAILRALEREVTAAGDAASTALEVELALADSLSPERRDAVHRCIEHHLRAARHAARRARDAEERAEYLATCARLRELRGLV
jgi:hypothetical protein